MQIELGMINPVVFFALAVASVVGVLFLVLARSPVVETANGGPPVARPPHPAPEKNKEILRERLIHAGLYKKNSPTFYYLTQIVFAAVPITFGLLAYKMGLLGFNVSILLGIIFGISGVVFPGIWLDIRKSQRQTSIRRSIPDALDVITICVEAGLSLSAAIVRVSKDLASTYPLLATELTIVHRQIQMGKMPGEALRSFAERFDLSELRSLSSVVSQSEKFGASIASALRVHGQSLRTKRMQMAHEKAQRAAIWILLPTVFCIFPALFVVILGPAVYDINELIRNMGK